MNVIRRMTMIGLTAMLVVLLVSTVVFAALYNIDTEDSTVAEWSDQGIPVFQTDPSGDATDARDDIVATWVASDNLDRLAFKMEVADPTSALSGNNIGAVASIDCNANGIDEERDDRLVIYTRGNNMWICEGDQRYCFTGDSANGQIVGNQVEWAVPIDDLPPDQYSSVDCRHEVKIRFGTANTSTSASIDETSPLRGWNIPTAINLMTFEARSNAGPLALVAAAAALLVSVMLFLFRRTAGRL